MLKLLIKYVLAEHAINALFDGLERNLVIHTPDGLHAGKTCSQISVALPDDLGIKHITYYNCEILLVNEYTVHFSYKTYTSYREYKDGSRTPCSYLKDTDIYRTSFHDPHFVINYR